MPVQNRPMPATPVNPGDERVLERFKPTTGTFIGIAGLLIAAFALGYVVLNVHSMAGLRIGLGAVFGAVVVWASQLRPRVTAYTKDLHLKGPLRDARVPYVLGLKPNSVKGQYVKSVAICATMSPSVRIAV